MEPYFDLETPVLHYALRAHAKPGPRNQRVWLLWPAFAYRVVAPQFEWMQAMLAWMIGVGKPLGIGLVLLAALLAIAGYVLTRAAWRLYLIRAWRRRQAR